MAFGALAVAVVTGIGLAVPYDVRRPAESLAVLLLTNPGGRVYRNLHYWSAQLFLVLTLAHTWRHVARPSERRLTAGVWARAALSLPLAAFVMLSGFILKGDAEGLQALRILTAAVEGLPIVGTTLSVALFGSDPASLQVLYVHHVATATVLTWLIVAEHARSVWPRLSSTVAAAALSTLAASALTPTLHDGLDPVLKGPWYFVGLQEILHFATRPALVTVSALLILGLVAALPRLSILALRRARIALAALMAAYAAVTLFAILFRGENWALAPPGRARFAGLSIESPLRVPPADFLRGRAIPVVLGRPEGCLVCHDRTRGLSAAHRPDAVGCASCHAGNPFSLDKAVAHRAMVLIPGNLDAAARTCGSAACHPSAVERVGRSIMTTMRGVIEVDRTVFGEKAARDVAKPATLGSSAADTHARQLCASCHLAPPKRELGSITESSRGGGCNACHLTYSAEATRSLALYAKAKHAGSVQVSGLVHPDLSTRTTDRHCFGCHSRSGRISTSYEGWHEREATSGEPAPPGSRTLLDGRVFVRAAPDVHFEKGLSCVDCHTAREVMGDGTPHARKAEQLTISCEDCHAARLTIETQARIGAESQRILAVRGRFSPAAAVLVTAGTRDPLVSTFLDDKGRAKLVTTGAGAILDLKPPSTACAAGGGHARLGCTACHAAWAPRCSGCHTSFDPNGKAFDHVAAREVTGAWNETGRDYRADPPTLGIRTGAATERLRAGIVETFVPGMVLTIDRNRETGHPPDIVFRRAYARAFSHTISARSRECRSCHNDPVALGYGRGSLVYARTPQGGRWTFTPAAALNPYDGLPADAWIGFLERAPASRTTRPDVRPFDPDEQKRILTVGACLTCHDPASAPMREGIADFRAVLRRASAKCLLPKWN